MRQGAKVAAGRMLSELWAAGATGIVLAILQDRYEVLTTDTALAPMVWVAAALLGPMALALILSFPEQRPVEVALIVVVLVAAMFAAWLRLRWNDESFGYDVGKEWVVLWMGIFAGVMALASASTGAWLAVGVGKMRTREKGPPGP